jgi:hypothetical protein
LNRNSANSGVQSSQLISEKLDIASGPHNEGRHAARLKEAKALLNELAS